MKFVIWLQISIGCFSKMYALLQITKYRVWVILIYATKKRAIPLQFLACVIAEKRLGIPKDPSYTIQSFANLDTGNLIRGVSTVLNCGDLSRAT